MPRILRSSNINQYSKICISNCGLFPKSQSSIFICFRISPPEQPSAICNLIYPVESVLFLNNPPCHSPCTSYYLHRHLTTLITMLHWTYALDICQARSFFSIHIITLLAAEASEPLFLSPISPLPLNFSFAKSETEIQKNHLASKATLTTRSKFESISHSLLHIQHCILQVGCQD